MLKREMRFPFHLVGIAARGSLGWRFHKRLVRCIRMLAHCYLAPLQQLRNVAMA
jgi:hypothetical protein